MLPERKVPKTLPLVLIVFLILVFYRMWPRSDLKTPMQEVSGQIMGTSYVVRASATLEHSELRDGVKARLDAVNQRMSTYIAESELSRFNAQLTTEAFEFSELTFRVLSFARAIHRDSQGYFDITVQPLVRAYGFGAQARDGIPNEAEREALLDYVGMDKLIFDDAALSVKKGHPKMELDLSAIAKGFAVDEVGSWLDGHGVADYMVELGGEILSKGKNADGKAWSIGIETPSYQKRGIHGAIVLGGLAVATSGDYRNFFKNGQDIVTHTFNPSTGMPIMNRKASVSVVHRSCAQADAWATALNAMGAEQAISFAQERGLGAMFLVAEKGALVRESFTKGFPPLRVLH